MDFIAYLTTETSPLTFGCFKSALTMVLAQFPQCVCIFERRIFDENPSKRLQNRMKDSTADQEKSRQNSIKTFNIRRNHPI